MWFKVNGVTKLLEKRLLVINSLAGIADIREIDFD
jgi:hypothetical protein